MGVLLTKVEFVFSINGMQTFVQEPENKKTVKVCGENKYGQWCTCILSSGWKRIIVTNYHELSSCEFEMT